MDNILNTLNLTIFMTQIYSALNEWKFMLFLKIWNFYYYDETIYISSSLSIQHPFYMRNRYTIGKTVSPLSHTNNFEWSIVHCCQQCTNSTLFSFIPHFRFSKRTRIVRQDFVWGSTFFLDRVRKLQSLPLRVFPREKEPRLVCAESGPCT